MGMLDELLYIKTFRKDQAETALLVARAQLAHAHRVEDEARQRLSRFQTQAEQDERAWYQDLCSRLVRPREIAEVQLEVAILRAEEQARIEALAQAGRERTQAQSHYTGAADTLQVASATRSKFEELAAPHHATERRELERREEQELEEVAGHPRRRDDEETQPP